MLTGPTRQKVLQQRESNHSILHGSVVNCCCFLVHKLCPTLLWPHGLKWESLWIQIFNFTLRFKQEKTQHYEKSMNFRNRQDWDWILVLPLASYVTLKSLIKFSQTWGFISKIWIIKTCILSYSKDLKRQRLSITQHNALQSLSTHGIYLKSVSSFP